MALYCSHLRVACWYFASVCLESEVRRVTPLVVQWWRLQLPMQGSGFNPWSGNWMPHAALESSHAAPAKCIHFKHNEFRKNTMSGESVNLRRLGVRKLLSWGLLRVLVEPSGASGVCRLQCSQRPGAGGEVAQSCLTLCDPEDCSPPGSSVPRILQARILEWVAISSSRGSSQPRDWTHISCISCLAGGFFT